MDRGKVMRYYERDSTLVRNARVWLNADPVEINGLNEFAVVYHENTEEVSTPSKFIPGISQPKVWLAATKAEALNHKRRLEEKGCIVNCIVGLSDADREETQGSG